MHLTAPVSPGEFLDKTTILEIKLARIPDAGKRANVARDDLRCRRVDRDLTGGVEEAVRDDALRIGTDGGRRLIRVNDSQAHVTLRRPVGRMSVEMG